MTIESKFPPLIKKLIDQSIHYKLDIRKSLKDNSKVKNMLKTTRLDLRHINLLAEKMKKRNNNNNLFLTINRLEEFSSNPSTNPTFFYEKQKFLNRTIYQKMLKYVID